MQKEKQKHKQTSVFHQTQQPKTKNHQKSKNLKVNQRLKDMT